MIVKVKVSDKNYNFLKYTIESA